MYSGGTMRPARFVTGCGRFYGFLNMPLEELCHEHRQPTNTNTVLIIIGTVIVVLLLVLVFGGGGRMMTDGMMNWWR